VLVIAHMVFNLTSKFHRKMSADSFFCHLKFLLMVMAAIFIKLCICLADMYTVGRISGLNMVGMWYMATDIITQKWHYCWHHWF